MSKRLPKILLIDSGFKYDVEDTYRQKCELLSSCIRGDIITYGVKGEHQLGNFRIRVFYNFIQKDSLRSLDAFYKVVMTLRALFYAIYHVFKCRLRKDKVDLIVTYDPLTTGVLGTIVSMITRTPLVIEVNGDYTSWANYWHIQNPFKRRLRRGISIFLESFTLRHAGGVKLLYPEQLDYFRNKIGKTVIRVFPNYLDVKNFRYIFERQVISVVGFPFHVKGVDIAIEAFKLISDKFPEWELEILGYYPEDEVKLIRDMADGNPRIRHLEPIFRKQMPEYIGSTGIVLCASRTEGFPRVIKEAMQSGKACIASNVGGLALAFENEKNGLIFENENIQQLADKLTTLIDDESLRKQLGENAIEYARREYSDEAYVDYAKDLLYSTIEAGK